MTSTVFSKRRRAQPPTWLAGLKRALGPLVSTEESVLGAHSGDAWFAAERPDAVVFARTTADVARLLRFAHKHQIPVTTRGAGRGYVGGCVPSHGGVVLSLARMNRIKEIQLDDGVAVVEPGVVTGDLQDRVKARGYFYPPDPASLRECSIGGNVATNAGGPRCLKYGVTRHYVLGLEVVLADGTVTRVGGRTHKNKAGFDLVGLFVGSEGMLGVVTEVTLRLIPHPQARAGLAASFESAKEAAAAVQAVFRAGFLPSGMEMADRFTLDAARAALGPDAGIPPGNSHVLMEIDGRRAGLLAELDELETVVREHGALSVDRAEDEAGCERIWGLRRQFSQSLKSTGLVKLNQDIVVPRSRLVDLFRFAERLQKRHGIPLACFGHAGDGNIHVNLMVDWERRELRKRAEAGLDELFAQIVAWGGSITGEHGIGLAKKRWWPGAAGVGVRRMHERIKAALDERGILNPGKFV